MSRCADCVYRWKMYSSQREPYCGYALDTGQPRNCPAELCDCFVEGTPHRRRKLIFSDKYYL